jgi:predicted transcriptional regulator
MEAYMTISDIREILGAKLIVGEEWKDREVHTACGSDMMSDVLAFMKDQSVLLTGLCNLQVIRTCEMMDVICIVFVRGKLPDESMVEMAKEKEIAILSTGHRMFSACGLLYEKGLRGGQTYRE